MKMIHSFSIDFKYIKLFIFDLFQIDLWYKSLVYSNYIAECCTVFFAL